MFISRIGWTQPAALFFVITRTKGKRVHDSANYFWINFKSYLRTIAFRDLLVNLFWFSINQTNNVGPLTWLKLKFEVQTQHGTLSTTMFYYRIEMFSKWIINKWIINNNYWTFFFRYKTLMLIKRFEPFIGIGNLIGKYWKNRYFNQPLFMLNRWPPYKVRRILWIWRKKETTLLTIIYFDLVRRVLRIFCSWIRDQSQDSFWNMNREERERIGSLH